ncbi:hypothetical protein AAW14_16870 [Streptomyces hygroscopicus]|nr:hypothetical protein [Streptomyces hygroscopicus]
MALRHTPLVTADRLASPQSYRQLSRRAEDEEFRAALEALLGAEAFGALCRAVLTEGAVSLTGLIPPAHFERFRRTYDAEMQNRGSRGALHSYLDIVSSTPLLGSSGLWSAVAHPLVVVVIAHALGGPIKIVDLRAKDTYPVDVVARDNTLHLDNSPFIDEYKMVVTWTLGTTKGPAGQGLTYLPRTNRLFRQCFVEADESVWSDEDACVFPSKARVDQALALQSGFLHEAGPLVVHLTDLEAPCHTIFAASRLVHHRYRTSAGAARSAVMASFHRTDDSAEMLGAQDSCRSPLQRFLMAGGSREQFLEALRGEMPRIVAAVDRMAAEQDLVVDPRRHLLTGDAFDEWYARQCAGVTLNDLRSDRMAQSPTRASSSVEWLVQRLQYDVQGPLNMPFFSDMRESRRKRARIRLREMSPEDICEVVETECARSPHFAALLRGETSDASVGDLLTCLAELDRLLRTSPERAGGGSYSGATDERAARSLPSFVEDLRVTAGWLEDDDTDSVITATAFALLASALGSRWFGLGDAGRRLTQRLLQQYLTRVSSTPGTPI